MRLDTQKFRDFDTDILVMVPNGPRMIERHINEFHPSYSVLMDSGSKVASRYLQIKKFFKMGTPTVFLVDQAGVIRYTHYAASMTDEPDNREPLAVLANLAHS